MLQCLKVKTLSDRNECPEVCSLDETEIVRVDAEHIIHHYPAVLADAFPDIGSLLMKSSDLINWTHHETRLDKLFPEEFGEIGCAWAPQTIRIPLWSANVSPEITGLLSFRAVNE